LLGLELTETDSGLFPSAGFDVNGDEYWDFIAAMLVF
jgi:hypothetical protein